MSCAMKTPSISVSMSRKAAIYSGHAPLDRRPAGEDADRHQEDREHDQHQGDAVDAERPGEAAEQRRSILDELPLRPADLVVAPRAGCRARGRRGSRSARPSGRRWRETHRQAIAAASGTASISERIGKSEQAFIAPSPRSRRRRGRAASPAHRCRDSRTGAGR